MAIGNVKARLLGCSDKSRSNESH